MRIQHNILAMNSYRNYTNNTSALSRNLEKLSSGYKINRAGDDAAGLAISEKMRAQIQGLSAAQKNVKDGISLVKTAEGALQEVQDMLSRMKYLATQSANGTYDDEVDRKALQDEVDQLKDEIDRIADSANFNGIALLDGSLAKASSSDGGTTDPGSIKGGPAVAAGGISTAALTRGKAATVAAADVSVSATGKLAATTGAGALQSTSELTEEQIKGLENSTITVTVTVGGAKQTVTITLVSAATQADAGDNRVAMNTEMKGTEVLAAIEAEVARQLNSAFGFATESGSATKDGKVIDKVELSFEGSGPWTATVTTKTWVEGSGGTEGTETAKKKVTEGSTATIDLKGITDAIKKSEDPVQITINGKVYEFTDDESLLSTAATADFYVRIGSTDAETIKNLVDVLNENNDEPDSFEFVASGSKIGVKVKDPEAFPTTDDLKAKLEEIFEDAVGEDSPLYDIVTKALENIKITVVGPMTLQIGDTADSYNQLEVSIDDMHSDAIGIGSLSVGTLESAQSAVDDIKDAINTVSAVRGRLGAIQNRLEHTQNNLSVMAENIQDAESTIRDTDVADEMMGYVKNNILIQSAQAMLAQANQVPQGVLQLLG